MSTKQTEALVAATLWASGMMGLAALGIPQGDDEETPDHLAARDRFEKSLAEAVDGAPRGALEVLLKGALIAGAQPLLILTEGNPKAIMLLHTMLQQAGQDQIVVEQAEEIVSAANLDWRDQHGGGATP